MVIRVYGLREQPLYGCICEIRAYDVMNPSSATDSHSQAEALQKENEKEETSEGNVRVVIFS